MGDRRAVRATAGPNRVGRRNTRAQPDHSLPPHTCGAHHRGTPLAVLNATRSWFDCPMSTEHTFPALRGIAVDTTDARAAAEFYRQLLGFTYHAGSEPPPPGQDDPAARDWLVLDNPAG